MKDRQLLVRQGDSSARLNLMLVAILLANFFFKLLIYYNTTSFTVSEAGASYSILEQIRSGISFKLFYAGFRPIIAYLAHFISGNTGNLSTYFWFQAFLATVNVLILYLIILKLTKSRKWAIFGILLASAYMDYQLLTPVFYTQVYEIFFSMLAVYLILILLEDRKRGLSILIILLIPLLLYLSVFFRSTLIYYHVMLLLVAICLLLIKKKRLSVYLLLVFILTIGLRNIIPYDNFRDKNYWSGYDFLFFGHTWYGGSGGEGSFVYEENRDLFNKRLEEYRIRNNYDSLNTRVRGEFMKSEIRNSVTHNTGKWILLQLKKVFFTYSIIPIRDGLQILTTGKVTMSWILAAFLTQLTFAILVLLFFVSLFSGFRVSDLQKPARVLTFLTFLYLIAATSLYGHYSERYRIVVIMTAIIPMICVFLSSFSSWKAIFKVSLTRRIMLLIVVFLIISLWSYQAIHVFTKERARYFEAIR